MMYDPGILIITTSKFHIRRARYVWRKVLGREDGSTTAPQTTTPSTPTAGGEMAARSNR